MIADVKSSTFQGFAYGSRGICTGVLVILRCSRCPGVPQSTSLLNAPTTGTIPPKLYRSAGAPQATRGGEIFFSTDSKAPRAASGAAGDEHVACAALTGCCCCLSVHRTAHWCPPFHSLRCRRPLSPLGPLRQTSKPGETTIAATAVAAAVFGTVLCMYHGPF